MYTKYFQGKVKLRLMYLRSSTFLVSHAHNRNNNSPEHTIILLFTHVQKIHFFLVFLHCHSRTLFYRYAESMRHYKRHNFTVERIALKEFTQNEFDGTSEAIEHWLEGIAINGETRTCGRRAAAFTNSCFAAPSSLCW